MLRAFLGCLAAFAVVSGMALGAASAPGVGDAAAGEALFMDRCASCHVPEGGGQGPSLIGVYGRKAAALDGYDYSAALKASGLTWTARELDRFLTNPGKAVPGTAMAIIVPDETQRADLIAYFAARRQSSNSSRLALPPAEVVSTVQVRSTANLGR